MRTPACTDSSTTSPSRARRSTGSATGARPAITPAGQRDDRTGSGGFGGMAMRWLTYSLIAAGAGVHGALTGPAPDLVRAGRGPVVPPGGGALLPRRLGPGHELLAFNGGEPVTWGGDTVALLTGLSQSAAAPALSLRDFLGGAPVAGIAYRTPTVSVFGKDDVLLSLGVRDKMLQCRAIYAPGTTTARSAEDASRMAMAASLLVTMPDVVRARFAEGGGRITLNTLVLGDISRAPVPASTTLPDVLPLWPNGALAGYDARLGTFAPMLRLFGLTFDVTGEFDLHARRPDDIASLLAGVARRQEFTANSGASDALRDAYSDPSVQRVAGSVRLLDASRVGGILTVSAVTNGFRLASTAPDQAIDLTLRTDAPYALLDAAVGDTDQYVVLGNVLAMRDDDASDAAAPYVADHDTLIFKLPLAVLDALSLKLVLVQQ